MQYDVARRRGLDITLTLLSVSSEPIASDLALSPSDGASCLAELVASLQNASCMHNAHQDRKMPPCCNCCWRGGRTDVLVQEPNRFYYFPICKLVSQKKSTWR